MKNLTITGLVILACMALVPGVACADVYKYSDGSGRILLTDKPVRGMRLIKRYRIPTGRKSKGKAAGGQSLAAMNRRKATLSPLIEAAANDAKLRPALIHAVVRAESAYRSDAISSKGAVGLMQLMPGTAERYGVSDRNDPAQNLRGGSNYLRDLLQMFDYDLQLALAAYNAGENAVIKYGNQIPPYRETQGYVRKVIRFFNEMDSGDKVALR